MDVQVVREGAMMGERDAKHFKANEEVLNARGHVLDAPGPNVVQDFKAREEREDEALPEREEQDGFDAEKLGHGVERREGRAECLVEQDQVVKGVRDGRIDDKTRVQVATGRTKVAGIVQAVEVQDNGHERHGRFHDDELHGGHFAVAQEGRAQLNGLGPRVHGPRMVEIREGLEHCHHAFLAPLAQVGNQEREKEVDDVPFVRVAHEIEVQRRVLEAKTEPRVRRVDRDHPQDADNLALHDGLRKVLEMATDQERGHDDGRSDKDASDGPHDALDLALRGGQGIGRRPEVRRSMERAHEDFTITWGNIIL